MRVGGCYVPDGIERPGRDALSRAGDRALGGVAGARENLGVRERFAVDGQLLERGRVAAALGQAVAAVAERVRAGGGPRAASLTPSSVPVGGSDGGHVGQVHALAAVEFDDP